MGRCSGASLHTMIELKELMLRPPRLTLAVAESLTCGRVQARIGAIPGASEFFLGGITAYSLEQKVRHLGVDRATAEPVNAVSAEVAEQMARGYARSSVPSSDSPRRVMPSRRRSGRFRVPGPGGRSRINSETAGWRCKAVWSSALAPTARRRRRRWRWRRSARWCGICGEPVRLANKTGFSSRKLLWGGGNLPRRAP